ncbi:MAG TPA: response regulator transcription factor [Chthoniobacteraceae bacterium]|jgi:DNA-binding NarL/FixJ family response regulator|nr:response regulator transcription factor [Chthoniobacteraceae bacterium]
MQTETAAIKVLLVEDHPMFRERLASIISKRGDMTVCGEADNARDALAMAESLHPNIAIVDITLRGSNGLDLLKDLKARDIALPVLVLSMHDEAIYAERVLRAGARGYITKYEASSEVMAAIEQVLHGEVYLSRQMTSRMLGRFAVGKKTEPGDVSALTDRELDVFQRIGRGESGRDIAEALHVGVTTIDTYRARIKEKLGLRNGTELQRRAMEWAQENPA